MHFWFKEYLTNMMKIDTEEMAILGLRHCQATVLDSIVCLGPTSILPKVTISLVRYFSKNN